MSDTSPTLSEQLGRVDGAQNDILKAVAKAFGITISDEKIDEIADLVTASGKFKQDALLSSETASLYPSLPENPMPNNIFEKIPSMFQKQKLLNSAVLDEDTSNVSFDVSEMDPKKKHMIRISLKNETLSGSPRIQFNFSDNSVIGSNVYQTGISKSAGTLNQNTWYFDLTEEGECLEFYVKISSDKRKGSITVDAITKTAFYFVSSPGTITYLNISVSSIGSNFLSVDFYEL